MANIQEYLRKLSDGTVSLEEQQAALQQIESTLIETRKKREEAVNNSAEKVVSALKQIEQRLNDKYEELLNTPAMVGEQGPQGPAGRDGKDGRDGINGRDGKDGRDGADGVDGKDGVSVVDATVDFDGSLVITLSDGNQIDAGQIFSAETAQTIQIIKGGAGGTALPSQTGNAGKYLTTNGTDLAWATVSGGGGSGTVTSVDLSVPTGLTVSGNPITTSGTLAVSYASGYAIPTTAKQTEWDTAYSWGNHASAGYLTTAVTSITAGTGLTGGTITGSGTIAIDSSVTTNSGTQTLTNKRITPRVSTTASSATPTINTDNVDVFGLTAQAVDITSFTTNLSGTPTDGQRLMIYIVGTAARAITWGASFEASTVPLPTTTVSTNRLDVGFVWNAATSKWRCVATA